MHRERRVGKHAMVEEEERARERTKESNRQSRLRPPREKAPLGKGRPVPVIDEVVEIEDAPTHRKGSFDHRSLEKVVQEQRSAEGWQENEHTEEHNGPHMKSRWFPPLLRLGKLI